MTGRAADDAWIPRPGSGSGPPALAFRVLALFLAVACVLAVVFSLVPAPDPAFLVMDRVAAVFFAVMALLTWYVMPRIRNGWGLDITLYVSALCTFAVVAMVPDDASRVLVGFALVLYGVFTAYFLPRARFIAAFAVMVVIYSTLAIAVPPGLPWFYVLAIVLVTSTVAAFVAELIGRLRSQALTDQLTGLLNRRGLAMMTPYVAADALRRETPTTVALIDLNGFKAYNDTHGHAAGDARLVEVAGHLRRNVRSRDIVARYGGDEFAVVLPDTAPQVARRVLERAQPAPGTYSTGVTLWLPGEDFAAALARADEDLYAAKRA